MPVFPTQPVAATGFDREQLVAVLSRELERQGESGEPLIFENPVQGTDKFFVVVVWSAWAPIRWSQRADLILEAYRRYDQAHPPESKANRITIASGMTWDEADLAAFFPFSITPNARAGEADPGAIRQAMLDEGGVETPTGIKLRFKLRDSAESAFARLQRTLPNAHWSLNQVVARIQDD